MFRWGSGILDQFNGTSWLPPIYNQGFLQDGYFESSYMLPTISLPYTYIVSCSASRWTVVFYINDSK